MPTVERVRAVVEVRDGVFYWAPRTADTFYCDRDWKSWTTRFEGKPIAICYRQGYATISVDYVGLYVHRLIWALAHGAWPVGQIDHINGIITDNRLENLRDVPRAINQKNRRMRCDNSSGATGVYLDRQLGAWRVYVSVDRRAKYVGLYRNFDDAVAARRTAQIAAGYTERHGRRVAS